MTNTARLTGFTREPNGSYRTLRPLPPEQIIKAAVTLTRQKLRRIGNAMENPEVVRQFLTTALAGQEHESFVVLFLDNRYRVMAAEELFRGTIDGASIYPREVVKAALYRNAAALIVAHNHPSGISTPSRADIEITERLKNALALVDIRLLDHMIVGAGTITSLSEIGHC